MRRFSVFAVFLLCCGGTALAQTAPDNRLSTLNRAVGSILDSLNNKSGDALKGAVLQEINGAIATDPNSAETIVKAVKAGAGANLPVFQGVLVGLCIQGALSCRLPALAPETPTGAVSSGGAGGAGGAAGGGGGVGGGPQTNFGQNHQSYVMSALAQNSDAQRFSFAAPSPSYGSSYSTRTVVINTPGPQLGAGGAPALLAVLWWIGRKLSRRAGRAQT